MKKVPLAIFAGILALALNGCPSSNSSSEEAGQPSPSPSPQASPSKPPTFERATVPEKVPTTTPEVAGLIPGTNGDLHRISVKQGRDDPFAMLPVEPIVKYPPQTVQRPPVVPTLTRQPSRFPIPPLPNNLLPPQPKEALAVVVSGVLDLSTPVAIVRAPGESVERRVTQGSTLSNGQVLVKAIYAGSSNPMVVLEQYGVEVAKRVGEEVAAVPKAI